MFLDFYRITYRSKVHTILFVQFHKMLEEIIPEKYYRRSSNISSYIIIILIENMFQVSNDFCAVVS